MYRTAGQNATVLFLHLMSATAVVLIAAETMPERFYVTDAVSRSPAITYRLKSPENGTATSAF